MPPSPFPLPKKDTKNEAQKNGGKDIANCEICKNKSTPESVPYIVHEASVARIERQIKRGWIALIVAVCLLFASNVAWLCAWHRYDYNDEEIITEQDAQDGGNTNYVKNDGDIVNGLPESESAEEKTN